MQHRRSYEISIFVIGCILINCIGKWVAETLQLPLWVGSFGTVLAAYVLGPICGAFIGAAVNIIYGFHSSLSIVYALTNVALGVLVGICAKKGFFENLFKRIRARSQKLAFVLFGRVNVGQTARKFPFFAFF